MAQAVLRPNMNSLHRWLPIDRRTRQPVRQAGFTLIELMVVVTVTAVLAAVATPSFKAFVSSQQIKSASIGISSALSLARSEAVGRNALVTVSPSGGSWAAGWSIVAADGTVLRNQNSGLPGVTVVCKTGGSAVTCPAGGIVFNGNGRLTASTTSIELSSSSTSTIRCVSVSLNGRPMSTASSC